MRRRGQRDSAPDGAGDSNAQRPFLGGISVAEVGEPPGARCTNPTIDVSSGARSRSKQGCDSATPRRCGWPSPWSTTTARPYRRPAAARSWCRDDAGEAVDPYPWEETATDRGASDTKGLHGRELVNPPS